MIGEGERRIYKKLMENERDSFKEIVRNNERGLLD
jgi:hypothetical protein